MFGLVDASVGFRAFWSHLRFAGCHDRPNGQPCVFVCVCSRVWRPNNGGIFQLRSNEGFVCCGF